MSDQVDARQFTANADSTPLTEESLRAAFDKLRDAGPPPRHGSRENPHVIHPDDREAEHPICLTCGWPVEFDVLLYGESYGEITYPPDA